ncbi:MAG: pyridoxal-phosphate dependent enzyme, partial [Deltaproteobacteria bacterium]|nr:pyridoxal-phosphate dependent enzyme [Deltaproteobacteria bacterium]
ALKRKPIRDPGAAHGLVIKGINVEELKHYNKQNHRLDYIIRVNPYVTEGNLASYIKFIQMLNLGLLITVGARAYERKTGAKNIRRSSQHIAIIEAYEEFEQKLIQILRKYDSLKDPERVWPIPLSPIGNWLRKRSLKKYRLEEALYPGREWVVDLGETDFSWNRLLPYLRAVEALMLDREAEENETPLGDEFINEVRGLLFETTSRIEDVVFSRIDLPEASGELPGEQDPFLDPENRAYSTQYARRYLKAIEDKRFGKDAFADIAGLKYWAEEAAQGEPRRLNHGMCAEDSGRQSLHEDSPHEHVTMKILQGDDANPHRIHRLIYVQDEHFIGITASCGRSNLPDEFQPSCGGLLYRNVGKEELAWLKETDEIRDEAQGFAEETDRICANWNTYLRGASTVLISDGSAGEKDEEHVLREWAKFIGERRLLGWRYVVTPCLGLNERHMEIVSDSAYEACLKRYLIHRGKPGDSKHSRIEEIIRSRDWESLEPKLRWKLGLILPVAGLPRKRGGFPPFRWLLPGVGLTAALEMILWHRGFRGPVSVAVDGEGLTAASIITSLFDRLPLRDKFKAVCGRVEMRKRLPVLDKRYAYSKEELISKEVNVLILADRHRKLTADDIEKINADIIIEAIPGLLSDKLIDKLYDRNKDYYSAMLVNGAMLMSAREELLHRLIPKLSEHVRRDIRLHVQGDVRDMARVVAYEELDRQAERALGVIKRIVGPELVDSVLEKLDDKQQDRLKRRLAAYSVGGRIREMADDDFSDEWKEMLEKVKDKLEEDKELFRGARPWGIGQDLAAQIRFNECWVEAADTTAAGADFTRLIEAGYAKHLIHISDVTEKARDEVIYGEKSLERVLKNLDSDEVIIQQLAAFHAGRLAQELKLVEFNQLWDKVTRKLLARLASEADREVIGPQCAKALGDIYPDIPDENLKRHIVNALVDTFRAENDELVLWADWALSVNSIELDSLAGETEDRVKKWKAGAHREVQIEDLVGYYQHLVHIYGFQGNVTEALDRLSKLEKAYEEAAVCAGLLGGSMQLGLANVYKRLGERAKSMEEFLKFVSPEGYCRLLYKDGYIKTGYTKVDIVSHAAGAKNYSDRGKALKAVLDMYEPHSVEINTIVAHVLNEAIKQMLENLIGLIKDGEGISGQLKAVYRLYREELLRFKKPYLALLLLYSSDILRNQEHDSIHNAIGDILKHRRLTRVKAGEKFDRRVARMIYGPCREASGMDYKQCAFLCNIFKELHIMSREYSGRPGVLNQDESRSGFSLIETMVAVSALAGLSLPFLSWLSDSSLAQTGSTGLFVIVTGAIIAGLLIAWRKVCEDKAKEELGLYREKLRTSNQSETENYLYILMLKEGLQERIAEDIIVELLDSLSAESKRDFAFVAIAQALRTIAGKDKLKGPEKAERKYTRIKASTKSAYSKDRLSDFHSLAGGSQKRAPLDEKLTREEEKAEVDALAALVLDKLVDRRFKRRIEELLGFTQDDIARFINRRARELLQNKRFSVHKSRLLRLNAVAKVLKSDKLPPLKVIDKDGEHKTVTFTIRVLLIDTHGRGLPRSQALVEQGKAKAPLAGFNFRRTNLDKKYFGKAGDYFVIVLDELYFRDYEDLALMFQLLAHEVLQGTGLCRDEEELSDIYEPLLNKEIPALDSNGVPVDISALNKKMVEHNIERKNNPYLKLLAKDEQYSQLLPDELRREFGVEDEVIDIGLPAVAKADEVIEAEPVVTGPVVEQEPSVEAEEKAEPTEVKEEAEPVVSGPAVEQEPSEQKESQVEPQEKEQSVVEQVKAGPEESLVSHEPLQLGVPTEAETEQAEEKAKPVETVEQIKKPKPVQVQGAFLIASIEVERPFNQRQIVIKGNYRGEAFVADIPTWGMKWNIKFTGSSQPAPSTFIAELVEELKLEHNRDTLGKLYQEIKGNAKWKLTIDNWPVTKFAEIVALAESLGLKVTEAGKKKNQPGGSVIIPVLILLVLPVIGLLAYLGLMAVRRILRNTRAGNEVKPSGYKVSEQMRAALEEQKQQWQAMFGILGLALKMKRFEDYMGQRNEMTAAMSWDIVADLATGAELTDRIDEHLYHLQDYADDLRRIVEFSMEIETELEALLSDGSVVDETLKEKAANIIGNKINNYLDEIIFQAPHLIRKLEGHAIDFSFDEDARGKALDVAEQFNELKLRAQSIKESMKRMLKPYSDKPDRTDRHRGVAVIHVLIGVLAILTVAGILTYIYRPELFPYLKKLLGLGTATTVLSLAAASVWGISEGGSSREGDRDIPRFWHILEKDVAWDDKRKSGSGIKLQRHINRLWSGQSDVARGAAWGLFKYQEDGLAVLKSALFSEDTTSVTKNAAVYGIRQMCCQGKMEDKAFEVLEQGLYSRDILTSRASLHGLFWMGVSVKEEKKKGKVVRRRVARTLRAEDRAEQIIAKFLNKNAAKRYAFEELATCLRHMASFKDFPAAQAKYLRIKQKLVGNAFHRFRNDNEDTFGKQSRSGQTGGIVRDRPEYERCVTLIEGDVEYVSKHMADEGEATALDKLEKEFKRIGELLRQREESTETEQKQLISHEIQRRLILHRESKVNLKKLPDLFFGIVDTSIKGILKDLLDRAGKDYSSCKIKLRLVTGQDRVMRCLRDKDAVTYTIVIDIDALRDLHLFIEELTEEITHICHLIMHDIVPPTEEEKEAFRGILRKPASPLDFMIRLCDLSITREDIKSLAAAYITGEDNIDTEGFLKVLDYIRFRAHNEVLTDMIKINMFNNSERFSASEQAEYLATLIVHTHLDKFNFFEYLVRSLAARGDCWMRLPMISFELGRILKDTYGEAFGMTPDVVERITAWVELLVKEEQQREAGLRDAWELAIEYGSIQGYEKGRFIDGVYEWEVGLCIRAAQVFRQGRFYKPERDAKTGKILSYTVYEKGRAAGVAYPDKEMMIEFECDEHGNIINPLDVAEELINIITYESNEVKLRAASDTLLTVRLHKDEPFVFFVVGRAFIDNFIPAGEPLGDSGELGGFHHPGGFVFVNADSDNMKPDEPGLRVTAGQIIEIEEGALVIRHLKINNKAYQADDYRGRKGELTDIYAGYDTVTVEGKKYVLYLGDDGKTLALLKAEEYARTILHETSHASYFTDLKEDRESEQYFIENLEACLSVSQAWPQIVANTALGYPSINKPKISYLPINYTIRDKATVTISSIDGNIVTGLTDIGLKRRRVVLALSNDNVEWDVWLLDGELIDYDGMEYELLYCPIISDKLLMLPVRTVIAEALADLVNDIENNWIDSLGKLIVLRYLNQDVFLDEPLVKQYLVRFYQRLSQSRFTFNSAAGGILNDLGKRGSMKVRDSADDEPHRWHITMAGIVKMFSISSFVSIIATVAIVALTVINHKLGLNILWLRGPVSLMVFIVILFPCSVTAQMYKNITTMTGKDREHKKYRLFGPFSKAEEASIVELIEEGFITQGVLSYVKNKKLFCVKFMMERATEINQFNFYIHEKVHMLLGIDSLSDKQHPSFKGALVEFLAYLAIPLFWLLLSSLGFVAIGLLRQSFDWFTVLGGVLCLIAIWQIAVFTVTNKFSTYDTHRDIQSRNVLAEIEDIKDLIINEQYGEAKDRIDELFMLLSKGLLTEYANSEQLPETQDIKLSREQAKQLLKRFNDKPIYDKDELFEEAYRFWVKVFLDVKYHVGQTATLFGYRMCTLYLLDKILNVVASSREPSKDALAALETEIIRPFTRSKENFPLLATFRWDNTVRSMIGCVLVETLKSPLHFLKLIRIEIHNFLQNDLALVSFIKIVLFVPFAFISFFVGFVIFMPRAVFVIREVIREDKDSFFLLNKRIFTEITSRFLLKNKVVEKKILEDLEEFNLEVPQEKAPVISNRFNVLKALIVFHKYGYPLPRINSDVSHRGPGDAMGTKVRVKQVHISELAGNLGKDAPGAGSFGMQVAFSKGPFKQMELPFEEEPQKGRKPFQKLLEGRLAAIRKTTAGFGYQPSIKETAENLPAEYKCAPSSLGQWLRDTARRQNKTVKQLCGELGIDYGRGRTRKVDVQERIEQIKVIVMQLGGIALDSEVAQRLDMEVASLHGWAYLRHVNLKELNVFSSKITARGKKKKLSEATRDEPFGSLLIDQGRTWHYLDVITLWYKRLLGATAIRKYYEEEQERLGAMLKKETDDEERLKLQEKLTEAKLILEGLKQTVGDCRGTFEHYSNKKNLKDPNYLSKKVTNNTNYRRIARGKLAKAVELLDANNESAAASPVASSIRHLRLELLRLEFRTRQRFWRDRKSKTLRVRRGQYKDRLVDGNVVSLKILEDQPFELDWEAAAFCDHVIDSNISEIVTIKQWLRTIKQARKGVKEAVSIIEDGGLLWLDKISSLQDELTEVSQQLNPRSKQEKIIAERSLGLARLLIGMRLRNAHEVLGLPLMFLRMRRKEAFLIVRAVQQGRLADLRKTIGKRNKGAFLRVKRVENNIQPKKARYRRALNSVHGLMSLKHINTRARIKGRDPTDEPEFVGLYGLLGQIAKKLGLDKVNVPDIEILLRRAKRQIIDAHLLVKFMIAYRKAWTFDYLKGGPQVDKGQVFFDVYKEFATSSNLVRGSPYLYAHFWRPATISYRLGKDKPRPINPAFEAVTCLYRIHQLTYLKSALTRHIILKNDVIREGRLIRKAQPITYQTIEEIIEELGGKDKAYVYRLTKQQRARIINALAVDFKPDLFQQKEMGDMTVERALSSDNAGRLFLEEGHFGEMPVSVLLLLRNDLSASDIRLDPASYRMTSQRVSQLYSQFFANLSQPHQGSIPDLMNRFEQSLSQDKPDKEDISAKYRALVKHIDEAVRINRKYSQDVRKAPDEQNPQPPKGRSRYQGEVSHITMFVLVGVALVIASAKFGALLQQSIIIISLILVVAGLLIAKVRALRNAFEKAADFFLENKKIDNKFSHLSILRIAIGAGIILGIFFIGRGFSASSSVMAAVCIALVMLRNILPDNIAVHGLNPKKWKWQTFRRRKLANDVLTNGIIGLLVVIYKHFGTDVIAASLPGSILVNISLDILVLSPLIGVSIYVSRLARRFPQYAAKRTFFVSFKTSAYAYLAFGFLYITGFTEGLIPSAVAFFFARKVILAVLMARTESIVLRRVWRNRHVRRMHEGLFERYRRIGKVMRHLRKRKMIAITPLIRMKRLSELTGKDVYLKDDSEQNAGTHRIRGVVVEVDEAVRQRIKLMKSNPELRKQPLYIVTYSNSNGSHGKALIKAVSDCKRTYRRIYPQLSGGIDNIVPVIFTIKEESSVFKTGRMQGLLGRKGRIYEFSRRKTALRRSMEFVERIKEQGKNAGSREDYGKDAVYINHCSMSIIAGNVYAGIEIDRQLRRIRPRITEDKKVAIIVPVGRGEPIGVAAGLKMKRQNVRAVIVQTKPFSAFIRSLITHRLERNEESLIERRPIYEDGFMVNRPDREALSIARAIVDAGAITDSKKYLQQAVMLMNADLEEGERKKDVFVGGTAAATGAALLQYYNSGIIRAINEADVIVLFAPEYNRDPRAKEYIAELAATISNAAVSRQQRDVDSAKQSPATLYKQSLDLESMASEQDSTGKPGGKSGSVPVSVLLATVILAVAIIACFCLCCYEPDKISRCLEVIRQSFPDKDAPKLMMLASAPLAIGTQSVISIVRRNYPRGHYVEEEVAPEEDRVTIDGVTFTGLTAYRERLALAGISPQAPLLFRREYRKINSRDYAECLVIYIHSKAGLKLIHKIMLDEHLGPKQGIALSSDKHYDILQVLTAQWQPLGVSMRDDMIMLENRWTIDASGFFELSRLRGNEIKEIKVIRCVAKDGGYSLQLWHRRRRNLAWGCIARVDLRQDGSVEGYSPGIRRFDLLDILRTQGREQKEQKELTWYPNSRGYPRIGRLTLVYVKPYYQYLKKLGIKNIKGLKFSIHARYLTISAIPAYGNTAEYSRPLHHLRLHSNGTLEGTSPDRARPLEVSILTGLEQQGEPLVVFPHPRGLICVNNVRYPLNEYLSRRCVKLKDVRITKQVTGRRTSQIQIRAATEGLRMGKVIDYIELDAKGEPEGITFKGRKRQVSFLGVLEKQGRASLDRIPDVRIAHRRTTNLSFNGYLLNNIHKYFQYLKKTGLRNLQTIRFSRSEKEIALEAMLKSGPGRVRRIYLATIALDAQGVYPLGVDVNGKRKGARKCFTLQTVLKNQGYGFELFLSHRTDIRGNRIYQFFPVDDINCSVAGFLSFVSLKAHQIKIIRYSGVIEPAGPRRIEVRRRKGGPLSPGEHLYTLDVDERGYPLGLPEGKWHCSLLDLLIKQGKIKISDTFRERLLHMDQDVFSLRGISFRAVTGYLAFLRFKGFNTRRLKVREVEAAIELIGVTNEARPIKELKPHKISVDEKRRPLTKTQNPQRVSSILKLLCEQAEITKDEYDEFISSRKGRESFYPTEDEAMKEKDRRKEQRLGITASDLKKTKEENGDSALYKACRRFGIALDRKQRPRREKAKKSTPSTKMLSPITAYCRSIASIKLPTQKEADAIWRRAKGGDKEAQGELKTRLTPLVIEVMKQERFGFSLDTIPERLFDRLIEAGNFAIATRLQDYPFKTRVLKFARRMIEEELVKEIKQYYSERARWRDKFALDKPATYEKGENSVSKEDLQSSDISLDDSAAILTEDDPYGIEQRINERDSSAGVPLILKDKKKGLASRLGEFFASSGVFSRFKNGTEARWALFTIGSLGRLGTAEKDNCDWNGLLLTELDDEQIRGPLEELTQAFNGCLQEYGRRVPTLLIGKDGDYGRVLQSYDSNLIGELVRILKDFGVSSPKKGFATIEVVSVNGNKYLYPQSAETRVYDSHRRALSHIASEEYCFQAGTNGILVAESHKGVGKVLVDKLLSKVLAAGHNRFVSYKISLEERFLQEQRDHLRRALAASRGEALEPEQEEVQDTTSSDSLPRLKYHIFQKRRWHSGTASVA